MVRRLFILSITCALSFSCHAGIETELFSAQYGECTAYVTHDAVPQSKTGTIVFKSYQVVDGIHYPCALNEQDTGKSLNHGFSNYLLKNELKPVTSIFIGRLIHYPWVVKALAGDSDSGDKKRLSHQEFNKKVFFSEAFQLVKQVVKKHGYLMTGVSCEKLMFYHNGTPKDAMCWLTINRQ